MDTTPTTNILNLKKRNSSYIPNRHLVYGDISSVIDKSEQSYGDNILTSERALSLKQMIEIILEWSLENIGHEEFVKAQTEFQNNWGKVSDEDSFYHLRMNYFLDYFLFQRIYISADKIEASVTDYCEYISSAIPYIKFMSSDYLKTNSVSEQVRLGFHALSTNRNSFFQVIRNTRDTITVKDLLTLERHTIQAKDSIGFIGLNSSMILQGFLFLLPSGPEFSTGVLIHPKQALGLINKNIKKVKFSPDFSFKKLLMLASKQNLATYRHRILDIKKIYASEPKFI